MIRQPCARKSEITGSGDFLYSHGTVRSAPSAVLAISFCARPKRSSGSGVYPERNTRDTPAASDVRNIEPTLCALRMLCSNTAISIALDYTTRYTTAMLSLFPQILFLAP